MYGKTLSDYPEKFEAFKQALNGLGPAKLDFGFQAVLRNTVRKQEFPTPAEILLAAEDFHGRPELKPLPRLPAKPEGWEPVPPGEVKEWLDNAVEKWAQITAMDAPAGPTLHEHQRAMTLGRLGGSTMPADPWGSGWHETMARKNGWK